MKALLFSLFAAMCVSTVPAQAQSLEFNEGLFNNVKWYTYNMADHSIWSHLDIYVIDADGELFAFQILGYYDPSNPSVSSFYTIRVQKAGGPLQVIQLEAFACGNAMYNPNFEACMKDPNQNAFTYLNLNSLETWQMSDADAKTNTEWDVSFKNTTVVLNSMHNGPKENAAALAYRDAELFKLSGPAFLKALQKKSFGDMDLAQFNKVVKQISAQ